MVIMKALFTRAVMKSVHTRAIIGQLDSRGLALAAWVARPAPGPGSQGSIDWPWRKPMIHDRSSVIDDRSSIVDFDAQLYIIY